ncbi:MAG: HAMP domain-containing histidine kinase [Firmicutes bacterium]|nr:HAMP domain-containing histidine kinase [Bacillota bacterium]
MNTKVTKKSSINLKTLWYLSIFSVSILFVLWLLQIMFLSFFYEKYQIKNTEKVASTILQMKEDKIEDSEMLAYKYNVCIEIDYDDGTFEKYNTMMNGCLLSRRENLKEYIDKVKNSNEKVASSKVIGTDFETRGIIYAVKNNGYTAFIFSPIEDINSTSVILKDQLIYITIIIMIISVIISYYLSRKITNPITNITKKAKDLGNGNYNLMLEESDIIEIDELSNTLNEVGRELSKTDEMRRDLMANVSHDLKTPLTMIKAYAEMIRDISYKDDKKREEHLNVIIDETDRLTILVNDILDMTKEEANADFLKREEYDLVNEIKNIISKYEIIKETENYKILLESPDEVLVKADKSKINQVIYNLINNAINYTGDDKAVTIKISEEANDYLVEIKDTGKGIDKKDIKYIWNKYYKQEKNHKRNVVGSGIGLSIVKSILERHSYEYGVNSKKNNGTTFYFKIKK